MHVDSPAITRIVSDTSSVKDVRVLAFPFAGGNANAFLKWKAFLPQNVEVLAYTPPGRGSRFADDLIDSMSGMVQDAFHYFEPYLDKPFMLFGHSLGGLLAYEFLLHLHQNNKPTPFHFISSARKAPDLPSMDGWSKLSDDDFIDKLDGLGGLHPDIASNQELIELLTPILRNDIGVVEYYKPTPSTPIHCEATIIGGINDAKVPEDELWMWQAFFAPKIDVHMYDEGHFYLTSSAKNLCQTIQKLATKELASV